jgi:predicted enzyme related to lactoylglutathione lyase
MMGGMPTSHISVLSVPVSDQDRAKAFYADVLGFEVLSDSPFGEGMRWVQLAPAGAQTSITLTTWLDDFPPGSLRGVILSVADLDAEVAAYRERGGELDGEVMDTPWGRFQGIKDPDGNRYSFHQEAAG